MKGHCHGNTSTTSYRFQDRTILGGGVGGVNGVCFPDPCGGIRCPGGQACKQGKCVAQTCPAKPCAKNETCLNGLCVPNRCQNVNCPAGQRCVDGECYGGNGPLPPATPNPVEPADPLTDGGPNTPATQDEAGPSTRRRGGCVCQTDGSINLPFFLLCLLVVIPLVSRRRRQA